MPLDIQTLSDRLEINDLLIEYCDVIDKQDFDRFDRLFTADARIDYTAMGGIAGERDTVREWLKKSLAIFPMTQHLIANSQVKLNGDTATARTMCHNPMNMPDGKGGHQVAFLGLWYVDKLVRTADGWRISERVEEFGYMSGMPEGFSPVK
ncbi:MAG TPA: nuclear transport factor 2 family protein [Pseudomonadales bacterium]